MENYERFKELAKLAYPDEEDDTWEDSFENDCLRNGFIKALEFNYFLYWYRIDDHIMPLSEAIRRSEMTEKEVLEVFLSDKSKIIK